jgi:GNAT superfamily N-acetyltransferase
MNTNGIQLVAYRPEHLWLTAQAIREVITEPPFDALSLPEVISELQSDQMRDGFGGLVATMRGAPVGLVMWHDLTGRELNDRWRPRFAPKDQVPTPQGNGALIGRIGVMPSVRGHGLGARLLAAALEQIEPTHEWVAMNAYKMGSGMPDMFSVAGFEVLPLVGVQSPNKICLLKTVRLAIPA